MLDFKKPNLNAPRFRPSVLEIANNDFFKEFKKKHPEYANVCNKELKEKIKLINRYIYTTAIIERDGVELPNGLGVIFIGSCPPSKKKNIDYNTSKKFGKAVAFRNWETDGNICKIFYTNYEEKYKFKFYELWGFEGGREFAREASKAFILDWTKYIVMENIAKTSRLFRKLTYKQKKLKEEQELLKTYDDLALE